MRTLLICLLLSATVAYSQTPAQLPSFRPWDLAYILPLQASQDEANQLLTISSLGYSTPEIEAMIHHISQNSVLPVSAEQDKSSLSALENGKPVLGGVLNDREGHNSTSPPTPFKITDAEGNDARATACFNNVTSWRMVQMRIGPYKIQPSGTPARFLDWAASHGTVIDRIIQVRIAFRPYCALNSGVLTPLPAAIHFAFELRPDDPNLMKDPAYTAIVKNPKSLNAVWDRSQDFMNASRGGNAGAANAALQSHLAALNSADYVAFRGYVLKAIAALAATRAQLGPAPFQSMNQALDELHGSHAFPESALTGQSLPIFSHPGLRSGAPTRAALLGLVNAFAQKYGTRGNVTAIAGFVTEARGRSYFSNFGMGGLQPASALPADSQGKIDYGLIHPNSLDTTVASLDTDPASKAQFIHLFNGKTADLYAQADAVGDSETLGFAFRAMEASTPAALIDQVDFNSEFTLHPDGHGNQTITFAPQFPSQGPSLQARIAVLKDPAQALPSTTSCVNCHVLPRVGLSVASDPTSVQILSLPAFLLLNEASLTARTEGELDHEFAKLNLEWLRSAKTACTDPTALRNCLDQADAASTPASACLDQLCGN